MKPSDTPKLLSFITPVYNAAATVSDAIESIFRQDIELPFEVVVVDDASTDDTDTALSALEAAHPGQINVSRNDRNQGAGATRNRAIAQAQGDVIYMLDADNVLPPETVRPQLELMVRTGLHCVSVERLDMFTDDPSTVEGSWQISHDNGVSGLRELLADAEVPGSHGNYLFTRTLFDAVGGYEEISTGADTWIFGLKHVARGFDVAVAADTSYFHRLSRDSYWIREERRGTNDERAVVALREMLEFFPTDVQAKVGRLRSGDPVFRYLSEGAFTPTGELPGLVARTRVRTRRRLSFGVRELFERARA